MYKVIDLVPLTDHASGLPLNISDFAADIIAMNPEDWVQAELRLKRCPTANILTNSKVGAASCRPYLFKISIPVGSRTLIERTGIFYSIH